jgi:hypothetical protein
MRGLFFSKVLNLISYGKDKHILEENKFMKNFKMSFKDFYSIYIR